MAQLPVKSQIGSITFLFFIISIIVYYDLSIGSFPGVINKSSAFEKHSIRRAGCGNHSVKEREKKRGAWREQLRLLLPLHTCQEKKRKTCQMKLP